MREVATAPDVVEPEDDDLFERYLRPGLDAEELPELYAVRRAEHELVALRGLLGGSLGGAQVRLHVLRELCRDGSAPDLSVEDLRRRFPHLEETRFGRILDRLTKADLLEKDAARDVWHLTPLARLAVASLDAVMRFAQEEDGDFGMLLSQVAGDSSVGRLSPESLGHLLSRLEAHRIRFEEALFSQSENEVRNASRRWKSVMRWVEKGTEILRGLADDPTLSPAAHAIARRIGQSQSALLKVETALRRTLHQMEQQRVHLGESGLSTSNIAEWLGTLDVGALVDLLQGAIRGGVEPGFLYSDVLVDVAHGVLEQDRTGLEEPMPPPHALAPLPSLPDEAKPEEMEPWLARLRELSSSQAIAELVPGGSYEQAAWRLSTLPLVGDATGAELGGLAGALAAIPVDVAVLEGTVRIDRDEIAELSNGTVSPRREP